MKKYSVSWTIAIEATSHAEAAEKALAIQRDPGSKATVFEVKDMARADPMVLTIDPTVLPEVVPLKDFKIDIDVIVWDDLCPDKRHRRKFAGIDKDGKPLAWYKGSLFQGEKIKWDHAVLAEENEDDSF